MRKFKRWTLIPIMLVVFMMAMIIPNAATPKLKKAKVNMWLGSSYKQTVSGYKGKISWSTSNKKVATVSSKGVIKAKKIGTAKITAKCGKKKLTCKVTVKQPVTKLTINKTSVTLKGKDSKYTLSVKITPSKVASKKIIWSSSNVKVATVSSSGVYSGKRPFQRERSFFVK